MSDVIKGIVYREPSSASGLARLDRGVILQPSLPKTAARSSTSHIPVLPATALLIGKKFQPILEQCELDIPAATASSVQRSSECPDEEMSFDDLHEKLHAAYLAKNAYEIESVASSYLLKNPILGLMELDHLSRTILQFFEAKGCKATQEELKNFVSTFSKEELREYFATAGDLVEKLKSQTIAAMAQGSLGQAPINILFLMKSIVAFQLLAARALRGDFAGDMVIPRKLIYIVLELNIFLPAWLFDIDPCKWPDEGDDEEKPRSPLAKRLAIKKFYKDKVHEKQNGAILETRKGVANPKDARRKHPHPDCQCENTTRDEDCDCCGHVEPECLPPDPCCAKINYYVADTLVLRQKTRCYVPDDLAYIENIAPHETRVRKHSFSKTVEDYTEEETTETRSEERDLQVSDRFSLKAEIEKDISQSLDVTAKYEPFNKISIEAKAHLSKDVAQREVREKFRETVDKAVTKLQVETRKLKTRRATTEEAETNKHKFQNTTADPAVAKYFYVSKEVEGQVYSHGVSTHVELFIPSPAMLYQHLEKLRAERAFITKKPKHPCFTINAVDPNKYEEYIELYELYELEPPIPQPEDYTQDFQIALQPDRSDQKWFSDYPINTPAGYTATSMEIVSPRINPPSGYRYIDINFAGGSVTDAATGATDTHGPVTISATGNQTAKIVTHRVDDVDLTLRITFTANQVDNSIWKRNVYAKVMKKYEQDLLDYEEALAEHNRQKEEEKFSRHPFALKEILLAEIKRAAIYMMCEDFEREGVMNMKSEPCGYPEINRSTAAEKLVDWYFWDRAFDWELMSFKFFDYFWNPIWTHPEKFAPGHFDFMFNAFLRAGYVRVIIPAAPTMQLDVVEYINTGKKWGPSGQHPLNPADTRWMHTIDEILHSHDCFQNQREGYVTGVLDTTQTPHEKTNKVIITGTDRYWDPTVGTIDQGAINMDLNREIYIDGVAYVIQGISLNPGSPPYDPLNNSTMEWLVTLERIFEGDATDNGAGTIFPQHAYAVGAELVGSVFKWKEPTDLVWIGDAFKKKLDDQGEEIEVPNRCLPCYPVECSENV